MNIYAFADEASPALAGQIAAMQRNGLSGLEIRGVDGRNVADLSPEKAAEVRKKLDDAGLVTWSIGSPIGKISIDDPFLPHLDKLRRVLDTAAILGAENVRIFSFYLPKGGEPAAYRQKVLDQLGQMLDAAEGTGVTLCHENEKGIYGDTALRCLDLHRQLPRLRGVLDPANYVQCGVDPWEAWTMLAPFIRYLHIKDALADGNVVPAGHGIGQVKKIVQAYRARGGAHLTVEPHLTVFDGLSGLEQGGSTSKVGAFVYPTPDAAFDAACDACKEILNEGEL